MNRKKEQEEKGRDRASDFARAGGREEATTRK